jgi:hypothetical protein
MSWAWEQTTRSAGHKLVLLALADHAGDDFRCFPSTGRIAAKTGFQIRTARRYIDALVADGLVHKTERRRRPDGSLSTWVYELNQCHPGASGTPMPVAPEARTSDIGMVTPVTPQERAEPSENHQITVSSRVSDVEVIDTNAHRLCELLADSIERRGSKRPTITDAWRTDMERLTRIDGRPVTDIERVIGWLDGGRDDIATFWAPNIRSPHKLRAKWDVMAEQYTRSRRQAAKGSNFGDPSADAGARALRLADELRQQRQETPA